MALARRVLLGATAALAAGGLMFTSAAGAPAAAVEAPPGAETVGSQTSETTTTTEDVEAAKVWKNVWRNAPSFYWSDGRAGTLWAGSNYFYCQAKGSTHVVDGYKNNWWLKTDDDNGNTNVWVNAVNISGGANFEPIAGVPFC